MNQFLYFVPGRETVPTLAELQSLGLGYAFDTQPDGWASTEGPGTDKQGGVVVSHIKLEHCKYYPDRQAWRAVPGTSCFVGYYTDRALPAPADLEREMGKRYAVECVPVPLADGRSWKAPVARFSMIDDSGRITSHDPHLACQYELDANGNPVLGNVTARSRWLWDICVAYFDWWHACVIEKAEGVEKNYGKRFEHAVKALSAVYRIGVVESVILGLFDSGGVHEFAVLGSLIGNFNDTEHFAKLEERQKKERAATSACSP